MNTGPVDFYVEMTEPFEVLRFGPTGVPQEVIDAVELLSGTVQDPTSVSLVICADIGESARRRMPTDHAARFTTARGSGTLGGKTMTVGDRIEVLIPAGAVFADDDKHREFVRQLGLRTVAHEGLHALVRQRGEDSDDEEQAELDLLARCAEQVINEFRVEAAIDPGGYPLVKGHKAKDILPAWTSRLAEVALIDYQEHRDVDRLRNDILNACLVAWTGLAYLAGGLVASKAATWDRRPRGRRMARLWDQAVADHWDEFCDLLAAVPTARETATRQQLDSARDELADLLRRWLQTVGFERTVGVEGEEFFIRGWSLLEAWLG